MGIIDKFKGLFSNLRRNVKLAETMNTVFRLPPDITELVEQWREIYMALPPAYANTNEVIPSGIAPLIANDIARKSSAELIVSVVQGETEIDTGIFTDEMMLNMRQQLEYAIALGWAVCRPYFEAGGRRIAYTWYTADRVIPTAWDGRKLTGCILIDYYESSSSADETIVYTKLEAHGIDRNDGQYHIKTKLFKQFSYNNGEYIGHEVPLATVPDWADITPDIVIQNPIASTFAYMGTPFSNNKTLGVPVGVSIFKDAVDWIHEFDQLQGTLAWERASSEAKVFVADDMVATRRVQYANTGEIALVDDLSSLDKRLYKKLSTDTTDGLFEEWAPNVRFTDYIQYANYLLHNICILCGLDPGQYVYNEKSDAVTAREIISKQQKTYSTIVDIQRYMVTPLVQNLVDSVRQLQMLYGLPSIPEDVEINCDFGDSILIDEQQQKTDAMAEVNAGLRSKKNYLMVIRQLSEADADAELALIAADEAASQPTYFSEGA